MLAKRAISIVIILAKFFWSIGANDAYGGYYQYSYPTAAQNAQHTAANPYYNYYNYYYNPATAGAAAGATAAHGTTGYNNNMYGMPNNVSPTIQSDLRKILQDIQILMQHEAYEIYRHRRSAPTDGDDKHKDKHEHPLLRCKPEKQSLLSECCSDSFRNIPMNERLQQIRRECLSELEHDIKIDTSNKAMNILSCDNINVTMSHLICMNECYAKKLKIINSSGQLLESEIKPYVKSILSQADWQRQIADQITEHCVNEVKKDLYTEYDNMDGDAINEPYTDLVPPHISQPSRKTVPHHSCDPTALKLAVCLWREFTKNCLSQSSTVRKCIRLQERYDDFVQSRIPPRDHVIIGV